MATAGFVAWLEMHSGQEIIAQLVGAAKMIAWTEGDDPGKEFGFVTHLAIFMQHPTNFGQGPDGKVAARKILETLEGQTRGGLELDLRARGIVQKALEKYLEG